MNRTWERLGFSSKRDAAQPERFAFSKASAHPTPRASSRFSIS